MNKAVLKYFKAQSPHLNLDLFISKKRDNSPRTGNNICVRVTPLATLTLPGTVRSKYFCPGQMVVEGLLLPMAGICGLGGNGLAVMVFR